ncbi:MAG: hypothetical protein ACKO6K_11350, partial [Chitinophagaceae bacterium]
SRHPPTGGSSGPEIVKRLKKQKSLVFTRLCDPVRIQMLTLRSASRHPPTGGSSGPEIVKRLKKQKSLVLQGFVIPSGFKPETF